MKETQWKTNITIKEYFPKLKKIPYNDYNCEISFNKVKQVIPLINKETISSHFTTNQIKKDLTYAISLINKEKKMTIGEANLIIPSFRLKQVKEIKKIKYEQQIKLSLNKKIKEKLFGPNINIGNIYLKFIIDIGVSFNSGDIFIFKLENKNIIGNNANDYNLSNLSLSSFLTNLSTLKENKKQNEKIIKNTSSFNNVKYLSTDNSNKENKNNKNNIICKEEVNNQPKRKVKIFSSNKIISLKKYKTKWHINREYLKSSAKIKNVYKSPEKNMSTSIKEKKTNSIIKNNKLRKAFSNENIRNNFNNIRINTEICNNTNKNNSYRKNKKEEIIKTERIKLKNSNKFKRIIKTTKKIDNNNNNDIKTKNENKNYYEFKEDIIPLIKDIAVKQKEIKNKFDNSKHLILKEKIIYQHKIMNYLKNNFEENNTKNFIHVNMNKHTNNFLLNKMTQIKLNELNIFQIIFNKKINNKNKNIDPKEIIKKKLKEQKEIQLLIKLIRNLIKVYGNLSHLFDNDNNKQILLKSIFLRYNIKEKDWNNEKDDLFDIYENINKKKQKSYYSNRIEEFNTIKEEEEEQMDTIE